MAFQLQYEGRSDFLSMCNEYQNLFLYCRVHNDYFFVIVEDTELVQDLNYDGRFQAVMEVTENIPLYKVAMNMQMGGSSSTTRRKLSVVNVEVVDCREENLLHDVYRLMF